MSAGTYVRDTSTALRARERYDRARDLGTMYSDAESVEFVATEVEAAPPNYVLAADLAEQAPQLLVAERLRGGTAKYIASVSGRQATYARIRWPLA